MKTHFTVKIFLTISLFLLSANLLAQRFKGGVMAGVNVSQIDGDSWAGYNKAGLVGGAFVYTDFTDKWGAQMEIRYAAKGSATPKNYSYSRKYRLQYIEIPVLATFKALKYIAFQGGLSFGYMFNAGENDGGYGYQKISLGKSTETALCVGANFSYFKSFDLNARFAYSVFPISAGYITQTFNYGALYNDVITFGVYFHIGEK